jgi:hypothetical protein
VATFDYNPITGQLDLVGGGASYIDGVVADSSLLPVTLGTPALDAVYLAKAGSGVWLINRKPAGLYVRVANNGVAADWTYLGAFPEVNADGNWELYNTADPTKELKFDLSGISASTVRTLTVPDANITLENTGHAAKHATGGSDAMTAFSIGGESLYVGISLSVFGATTLSAGRAQIYTLNVFTASTITFPTANVELGDRLVVRGGSPVLATATMSATGVSDTITREGQQLSYVYQNVGGALRWVRVLVDDHDAAAVTTGTFANARINFAAPAAIGNTTPNTLAGTQLALHDGSDTGTFVAASKLTDDRTYDLPDASGTLALLETLPAGGSTNLWIPASAWIPKTTAGCGVDSRETATHDQNFDELLFDTGSDEFADALVVMPSNYNNGTITARFYWTAASGSGGVAWAIQGRAFANDDALDTAAGTAQLVTDTLIAANDMHITSATSAVTIGGTPAANTPIQFTIYRDVSDAGDDLAVDARLLGVEILFN